MTYFLEFGIGSPKIFPQLLACVLKLRLGSQKVTLELLMCVVKFCLRSEVTLEPLMKLCLGRLNIVLDFLTCFFELGLEGLEVSVHLAL